MLKLIKTIMTKIANRLEDGLVGGLMYHFMAYTLAATKLKIEVFSKVNIIEGERKKIYFSLFQLYN